MRMAENEGSRVEENEGSRVAENEGRGLEEYHMPSEETKIPENPDATVEQYLLTSGHGIETSVLKS